MNIRCYCVRQLTFQILIWLSFQSNFVLAGDVSFSVKVPARSMECFFQTMAQQNNMEFEFQVIQGGNFDIDCHIKDPSMRILKSFKRLQDGRHTFNAEVAGDYAFCFDNTYSTMVSKLVFMSIETDAIEEDMEESVISVETMKEQEYDGRVEDLNHKLKSINTALNSVIQMQSYFRGRESRHRKTVESNGERVFYLSFLQILVIIIVSVVQVVMVRVFFRDKNRNKI